VPGVTLQVTDRQPFGGPLTVRHAGGDHPLGGQLAAAMRVA
jgi:DtxR family transcriptional regulator, Mn-dependent transcriptional regulator